MAEQFFSDLTLFLQRVFCNTSSQKMQLHVLGYIRADSITYFG